ncbi:hypothetical protein [Arthrobacter sp. D1-17]
MITLEGRQTATPSAATSKAVTSNTVRALRTGAVTGPADETFSAVDIGLMATFSSRLHCRRPMQMVDPNEVSPREPLQVGGLSDFAELTEPAPAERPVTYRCQCGFTMDEAAVVSNYAVAS